MPRMWITEYRSLSTDGHGHVIPLPLEPSRTQAVDFGNATLSEPFRPETAYVRLISNADAYVEFGEAPVATARSEFIPARSEAFRRVGRGHRISAYDGMSE